jgi:7-cyano-7-deazaguanine tRNA-ribosyltransferase
MTDSGAYQILVYGNVGVTQNEIVDYQERIGSDIATILDIPTGWKITKDQATETVKETLRRAKEFFKIKKRDDIFWVGPVQGGRHLDLVAKSAVEMSKLPFQIHALGSPTEIMESYRFDVLTDMIITAKMNLPVERPLHLFGAGHPVMFSLAVALGCDFFDSAAYALYARENRYMTENGTWRLNELDHFPCQCPRCTGNKPKDILTETAKEREIFLAEHNLHVCQAELHRIKQAIKDGRLWEHMKMRAHAHPALMSGLKKLKNYENFIAKHSPTVKRSGLFFFDAHDLSRAEIVQYRNRLSENYSPPAADTILLLVPQTHAKPFHKAKEFQKIKQGLKSLNPELSRIVHVCFYAAPFGVTPIELDEVYPLSQHEAALPLDKETIEYVAEQVADYVERSKYTKVVLLHDPANWDNTIKKALRKVCRAKQLPFEHVNLNAKRQKTILTRLEIILNKKPSE